jgi:excisionase family DNA binding protein
MKRIGPRQSPNSIDISGGGAASEQGEGSPTRELIVRLEAQVTALTGAVRGLEERLPSRLVSVEEAAEHLSISVQTVRRWCKAGQLAYVRRGRELRIDLTKVRAVMDADLRHASSQR